MGRKKKINKENEENSFNSDTEPIITDIDETKLTIEDLFGDDEDDYNYVEPYGWD